MNLSKNSAAIWIPATVSLLIWISVIAAAYVMTLPESMENIFSTIFFLTYFVIVGLLIFLPSFLYLRFSASPKPLWLGIILAIIHSAVFMLFARGMYFAIQKEGFVESLGWALRLMLDWPAWILADVAVLVPFFTFRIFGSLYYLVIGIIIGWMHKKFLPSRDGGL